MHLYPVEWLSYNRDHISLLPLPPLSSDVIKTFFKTKTKTKTKTKPSVQDQDQDFASEDQDLL